MKKWEKKKRNKPKKKQEKEAKAPSEQNKKKTDEEELDPTKYFENRKTYLKKLMEAGENPFPHKFEVTISLPEFIQKYTNITKKGEFLEDIVQVAGRVNTIRKSGASLIFYDIKSGDSKIQIS